MAARRKKPAVDDTRETCDPVTIVPGVRMRAAGAPHRGKKVAVGPDGYAIVKREIIGPKSLTFRPLQKCPYGDV